MSILKLSLLSSIQQYFEPNDKDKYNKIPKRDNLSKILCFVIGYSGSYNYSGTIKEILFSEKLHVVRITCNMDKQYCWGQYHEYLQGSRLLFLVNSLKEIIKRNN